MDRKKQGSTSKLAQRLRREKFARVVFATNDPRRAIIEAGFKPTEHNIQRQMDRLPKDPIVKQTLKQLMEEKYPVAKAANDISDLINKAVQMAKDSPKLPEVLATLQTLTRLLGVQPASESGPKQHFHLHASAPAPGAPGVLPTLELPKT